jgi:hypothetical protein
MAFKHATRREYTQGDSFSPSDNKDVPLLVQIVEFTEPIETYWTKKNDEDPKPAVKVHVIDTTARRPEVAWNVLWFDQHYDQIERMVDDEDIEIGETFLMRFADVQKKRSKGTYVGIVEPDDDDIADAEAFEDKYGDLFAEGPPKPERAPQRPGRASRELDREERRPGRSGRRSAPERPEPRAVRETRSVRNRAAEEDDEDERPVRSSRRDRQEREERPARRDRPARMGRSRAVEPDPDEEALFAG